MKIVVHGGAGSQSDEPATRQATLQVATDTGCDASTPIEAALAGVCVLESDPLFNAGLGSAVQSDGRIRTDAGLMTGEGAVGAACAMEGVEHASEVARVVTEQTPHVLVAGERARDFAAAFDIATEQDLWTDWTRERWEAGDPPSSSDKTSTIDEHETPADTRAQLDWVRENFGGHDTVGAVATDGETVAAVTSTGGRWGALAGRVGDVPQVGAGFYATEDVAVSATGEGEAIARFGLARAVANNAADLPPQLAADRAITRFESATDATAGVIVINRNGQRGSAHNAESMQTAASGDDEHPCNEK